MAIEVDFTSSTNSSHQTEPLWKFLKLLRFETVYDKIIPFGDALSSCPGCVVITAILEDLLIKLYKFPNEDKGGYNAVGKLLA